jgi:cytochrome c peroxidase
MRKIIMALFIISILFISFNDDPLPGLTKASLGKKLFHEKLLSKDSAISCASCHKPLYAFADTSAFSTGIYGKLTKRNTPSVLNMKNRPYFFWDGRAGSLEEQSVMPIQNPDEMGLPLEEAIGRLNRSNVYIRLFEKLYKEKPNAKNLAASFAAYENTLETVDSKFDDCSNDSKKLSEAEERGRKIFISDRAKCFNCHFREDFTDDGFKNIGLYNGIELNDPGLFAVTQKESDMGKFKTPGLRNVAVTAPYMHNGMFKTLEQVVDYYNDPSKFVSGPINMDKSLLQPIGLSEKEKHDLVSFLKTLTDRKFIEKLK